jgi:hypothetical protein
MVAVGVEGAADISLAFFVVFGLFQGRSGMQGGERRRRKGEEKEEKRKGKERNRVTYETRNSDNQRTHGVSKSRDTLDVQMADTEQHIPKEIARGKRLYLAAGRRIPPQPFVASHAAASLVLAQDDLQGLERDKRRLDERHDPRVPVDFGAAGEAAVDIGEESVRDCR